MLQYPQINPIAFQLGPLAVHWYGLAYLAGFLAAWALGRLRIRRAQTGLSLEQFNDLLFYAMLGVIIGGRLGYMLFYDFGALAQHPWEALKIWQGGMSFHGGLLGVIAAVLFFARRHQQNIFAISDFLAPLIPLGLGFGRLANFINGELWGRVTDLPWGMVFPQADPLPRHPSQLYEFILEGIVFFLILWFYSARPRPRMAVSGMFLLLYGTFRFILEFTRLPDPQLGFIAWDWLTMGQLLSLPMILSGGILLYLAYGHRCYCHRS